MSKFRRIATWIIAIVILLAVLLVAAVELFFPVEKAKQYAIEEGTKALGRPIDVGGVDVSIWGGLGIELLNVTVANPEDWPHEGQLLAAKEIDVKLQLLPLLSGDYRLDRLIIDRPEITLRKLESGRDNFSFPVTDTAQPTKDMPSEAKSAAIAVSFDRLEINNGRLTFIDDSAQTSMTLVGLDLSTALENPRQAFYHSSGRLAVDSFLFVGEDTVPSVALQLRYNADYDMQAKRLLFSNGELKINDLRFNLSGELSHADPMTARGNLRSKEVAVRDLFSLMPPAQLTLLDGYTIEGEFTLDADLQYNAAAEVPLGYSGNATFSDVLLAYNEVEGELRIPRAMLDFKTDNVRLNIEDGTFDGKPLKGFVRIQDFDNPTVNTEISGELNLAFAKPFLPAESNTDISGNAAFSLKIAGPMSTPDSLELSGNLTVADGAYSSNLIPEPIESFGLDIYFDNRLVRVNSFDASMPSGTFSFQGRINDLLPYLMADTAGPAPPNPYVDGSAKGNINLAMLNSLLPPEGDPEVAGMASMDLTLAGDIIEPSGLHIRGSMSITDGSYKDTLLAEPIEYFETDLTIVPDTIRVDRLIARFRTSDLSLTGSLRDPFPYLLPLDGIDRSRVKKPFLSFHVSSTRFNVDSLFPETSPTAEGDGGPAAADTIPPLVLPNVDGAGTADFDTVIYMDVEFTNITADLTIKDRVVSADNVIGKVYSGDIIGETQVDFNDVRWPVYDGNFDASQIEINDFVSRFTPFGGYLYGKFNLDGNYQASGWVPDTIRQTLTMNSDASMREGRLVTDGAVYEALNSIGELIGEPLDREQSLRNVSTDIIVKDGKVRLDKLTTSLGNIGDLEITGFYSFQSSRDINYTGSIKLTEDMTRKILGRKDLLGSVGDLLGGSNSIGRLTVPIEVGGTLDKPVFKLNAEEALKSVVEQSGKNILEGAGDKIKDLLKKD